MKRVGHLKEKLVSDENLALALFAVNHTHKWLPGHKPNKTVAWVEQDIPARIAELREVIIGITDGKTRLAKPLQKRRWDKSAGKWRDISEPLLWPDQYVHHALIQVLEPVMMRGMDKYCCGSIRGRGIHYGMRAIKKWMKNEPKKTRYCLQFDIRHFYDSIQPQFVMARLRRLVKDRSVLALAEATMEYGVLIGLYCSQWFANTLLQPLDQILHRAGASRYLRYMDNFTIFGPNKRKLHKVLRVARGWLTAIGLTVKGDWQVFRTARLPCALGYRYGGGYTLLRKRNLLRLKRALARYYKRKQAGRPISRKLAAGLLSRLGQLRHCNRVQICRRIYQAGTQKELKDVVRKYARKEQQWNICSATTA